MTAHNGEDNEITLNNLASMVKHGFDDITESNDNHFVEVHKELHQINERLDRMENILIAGHDRRIERLEDTVRQLITAAGIK